VKTKNGISNRRRYNEIEPGRGGGCRMTVEGHGYVCRMKNSTEGGGAQNFNRKGGTK
jgi:hypothetical protein